MQKYGHIYLSFAKLEASYASVVLKKKISKGEARGFANSGVGFNHLHLSFKRDQNVGVKSIFKSVVLKGSSYVVSKPSLKTHIQINKIV